MFVHLELLGLELLAHLARLAHEGPALAVRLGVRGLFFMLFVLIAKLCLFFKVCFGISYFMILSLGVRGLRRLDPVVGRVQLLLQRLWGSKDINWVALLV